MITTNDLRPGVCFKYDGDLWKITEFAHVKPGKGPAFVRVKQLNLRTGSIVERTYRAGEKVEDCRVENREMQYLYHDASGYVFMDTESYEQYSVPDAIIGDKSGYLLENSTATVVLYESEVIDAFPPNFIVAKVVRTDPGLRGDTAQGGSKPATIESGATINVPLFINEGDTIRVDTRDGRYIERAK
jgi:elongation factor P